MQDIVLPHQRIKHTHTDGPAVHYAEAAEALCLRPENRLHGTLVVGKKTNVLSGCEGLAERERESFVLTLFLFTVCASARGAFICCFFLLDVVCRDSADPLV